MGKTFKKMAKTLPVAAILLSTVLAGCSSSSTESSSTSTKPDGNFNKTGLPIVKKPITLNVLTVRWGDMGDTFVQNQWLKDLEKKTNVKIKWEVKSSNDWGDQKSIMMASGTLPDIIIGDQSFSDSDIVSNVSSFRPLDDYINKDMPNLKAAMAETPILKKISTFPDGKIYSLPARLPSRPVTQNQPIINKTWLDKLGLKVPQNIDELYTVLKAFKEKDPNGNGKQDEIPITGSKDISLDYLSLFGITDFNNSEMFMKDGKPVFYPTADEYKEALDWMHKLYAEGLIDHQLFTQDATVATAKRENPSAPLIGFHYSWTPDADFKKWKDQYVAIPTIAGQDGKRYNSGDPNGLSFRSNEVEITSSSKYPDAAARWVDQFYTNEASIQNFWGAIGTSISKDADGTYSLMAPPKGTSSDAWYWQESLRDFGPKYVSPSFEKNIKLDPTNGDGLKLVNDKLGKDYVPEQYPNVKYTQDEYTELSSITTDINTYIAATRAKWITKGGNQQDWDAYVKKLNDMGLQKLIKIRKDAYKRYMEIK